MLAQDPVTGQLYEVPESQLYETSYAEYPEMIGEPPVVYDGLGNHRWRLLQPLGLHPFVPDVRVGVEGGVASTAEDYAVKPSCYERALTQDAVRDLRVF